MHQPLIPPRPAALRPLPALARAACFDGLAGPLPPPGWPERLRRLAAEDPAAAARCAAQAQAVAALARARNRGLAEHLLPALLSGERAACAAAGPGQAPLVGTDTGRGWRLDGVLSGLANLSREGFTVLAPARLAGATGWVALRSEEDGLDLLPPHPAQPLPWARAAQLGDVRCRAVFFREDEWLGDEDLAPALQALLPAGRISDLCSWTFP